VRDIKQGEPFTKDNLRVIRPGDGLHPKYYPVLLGKEAPYDLKRGTSMSLDTFMQVSNK
jgi:sialic acid synthase SpsE